MASSSEQLSVVEKIVGDEDNDYDDMKILKVMNYNPLTK